VTGGTPTADKPCVDGRHVDDDVASGSGTCRVGRHVLGGHSSVLGLVTRHAGVVPARGEGVDLTLVTLDARNCARRRLGVLGLHIQQVAVVTPRLRGEMRRGRVMRRVKRCLGVAVRARGSAARVDCRVVTGRTLGMQIAHIGRLMTVDARLTTGSLMDNIEITVNLMTRRAVRAHVCPVDTARIGVQVAQRTGVDVAWIPAQEAFVLLGKRGRHVTLGGDAAGIQ